MTHGTEFMTHYLTLIFFDAQTRAHSKQQNKKEWTNTHDNETNAILNQLKQIVFQNDCTKLHYASGGDY